MSETAEKLRQLSVWLLSNDIDMKMPEGMIDPEVGADEIDRLTARVRELEEMVRRAYNDGFCEGVKEHTTNRGGTPWHLSKWRALLTPTSNGQTGGE